jgi:hypothetical protein
LCSRRAAHAKAQKGRSKWTEDLFSDEEFEDAASAPQTTSASASTPPTEASAPPSDQALKTVKPVTQAATFDELFQFIVHHMTKQPSALEPSQIRNSSWNHLFAAAQSQEDLRKASTIFADWVGFGRKWRDQQILQFVGE